MPIFWLGLMLILLFAYALPIFPSSQRLDAVLDLDIQHRTHFYLIDTLLAGNFTAFRDAIAHLILPAITLGTIPLAIIARMTRSSLLEILNQQYIVTAYAKGLPKRIVILKHALKNSIIPVLTVIGLEFGYLMGGAILTEHIFSWPGLGSWLRAAVEARDIRPIQGGVLFVATVFMTVNLIVDLLYAYFDPRIRIRGDGSMREHRRQFYRELLRQKSALIGASILIFFILIAIFAPIVATHDPRDADVTARLKGWSQEHYFGTDKVGRDIFSRIVYGSRISIKVGLDCDDVLDFDWRTVRGFSQAITGVGSTTSSCE